MTLKEKISREIGQHAENCSWEDCSDAEQDAAYRSADFIIALINQWLQEKGAVHRVCIQVIETGPVDGATTIVTRDEPLRIS